MQIRDLSSKFRSSHWDHAAAAAVLLGQSTVQPILPVVWSQAAHLGQQIAAR
ncbi:hypothetical protein HJG54_10165 [Leptolyngbya sp. NK1-12]|uniref:Uncharacterized protein n=1 Tax=Leptolyngbya sp. NK1-12 TaxID=2547451 RepID=A0AA96WDC5_9CYAN|nr:hypothetical protein [Leptolyngbya sp. NK1-12]WNZ23183.1 hypothetical protein HJG54_10165 [Leptolyngbya sp. NK1-12]